MKNSNEIEIPRINIERDALIMYAFISIGLVLTYCDYLLFKAFNPWGFLVMVPAAVFIFQSIWLILHPFALVFNNRIDIKRSLFSNKTWYFIDIKKVSEDKKGGIYITYNDGEMEKLNLFGIRKEHIALLKNELEKNITLQSLA